MAKIGTTPSAERYDGLGLGPRLEYNFEIQEGIPVDGTSDLLRDLSPFTLRILPPSALLEAAAFESAGAAGQFGTEASVSASRAAVDLITKAALGADGNPSAFEVAKALSNVSAIGNVSVTQLEKLQFFVANGEFMANQDAAYVSSLADARTAADIAIQLINILNAPPLTLLINPAEMSISYTNIQNYSTRTRFGYVFERWGEEQPTITFRGSTGGFVAGTLESLSPMQAQLSGTTSTPTGYQFASKRNSAAWQNFTSLYQFYRSNGYIYDISGGSEAHNFIGALAIDFDQWTYVGRIDSFSYSYDEGSPHRVEFDISFVVSQMYDTSETSYSVLPQLSPVPSPSDPQWSNRNRGSNALSPAEALTRGADLDPNNVGERPNQVFGSFFGFNPRGVL